MAKKAFNTTEEAVNLYDELYQSQVEAKGVEYTHGAFFAELVESYQRSQGEASTIAELREQLTQKEAELNETNALCSAKLQELAELREVADPLLALFDEYEFPKNPEALDQLLSAKPEIVERTVEVPAELAADQILLTIPEPTLPILLEVCRRLSAKFGREVSPADVLLDGFIKYNVEQYQEWFYPLTISEGEFHKVCGYTHEQLLKWLRNSK